MCSIVSCVVGKGCLLWPVCSLDKTLLAFALLHFVYQGQSFIQLSFDFLLLHFNPLWWKGHFFFFLVLVLEGLVGLHRTIQLQLLQHQCLGHRLGLLWCWMVCLGNEQRLFCPFWDCTQVLHLSSFVDYEGYSISSKGFLPIIVDTVVIWIKFAHSCLF